MCMHGRQAAGQGARALLDWFDVTTRPDHKTFDRPHCGFADCVQERARKWKCVSRLRSSMKNHKTWTSMPHVYISMLYFGLYFLENWRSNCSVPRPAAHSCSQPHLAAPARRGAIPVEGWRPWNCAASETGRGLAREFLAGAESGVPRVNVSVGLGWSGGSRVNTNWNLYHKTWTSKSMPHVHISMLYFGALFPRELATQLFCWARHESLVFSGVFTGEEVPRE